MYAKDMCFKFNNTKPSDLECRNNILKNLFGKIGKNFHIESNFWCDYGYRIEIGENFYANHDVIMLDAGGIYFWDNVFVVFQCGFYISGRPIDVQIRNIPLEYAKPIKIGNNVWIGAGVQVCPGSVVIGAGIDVVKDIEDNTVAIGNPCKIIKYIK